MNMSDVEGSADQDCRVHHKSGGNQEVRRFGKWIKSKRSLQIEQNSEISGLNGTPTTRLNFPLLLSWSWMLKEGNFSFFGWTQFVRLLFLVFSQLYVQKSFKLFEVRIWPIVQLKKNVANRELDVIPDIVMSGALQHIDHLHVDWTKWVTTFNLLW